MPLCYSAIPSRSLRRDGADLKGFGISQQAFCNAKIADVYTSALLAGKQLASSTKSPSAKVESFDDDGSRFLIGISKKMQGHKKALTESDQKALKKSVEAPADHSIHIAAIEGAYDAFIENWELTFREYPDLLTGPENWKQIEKYSDNLQRYLKFIRSKHLKMLESQRQGG